MSKRWETVDNFQFSISNFQLEKLIALLLKNRGIKTAKERETFLHPKLADVTTDSVGIDKKGLQKALKRIQKAITNEEQIVVFGDYDVDGITGSAILWETLHAIGAKCMPYIPSRMDEGYGLSVKALDTAAFQKLNPALIITVDNGIVANKAVEIANERNIDVIITDHHTLGETLPKAHAIVHTTQLCGAGVAYLLSKEINKMSFRAKRSEVEESHTTDVSNKSEVGDPSASLGMTNDIHLELAALGTVADLVPLTGANRTIVLEGIKKLQTTTRVGLTALFTQAGIKQDALGVYDIGYLIGPRLNAAGRLESAMDSLRLLCTQDSKRAYVLASQLEVTNRERQQLLKEAAEHAIASVNAREVVIGNILIVGHETYPEGVIGLVAGKLVEAFYRPAIVLTIGETHSKASARSVSGFNIIEFLRSHPEFFVNVGGHPMAAGFTIETANLALLTEKLEQKALELLDEETLTRRLKIDCALPFSVLNQELYEAIQQLAPFGMGNPEPTFATKGVIVESTRVLGKDAKHLRLNLQQDDTRFEAIAFGMGELSAQIKAGDKIDVAYTVDENTWNGNTKLQLKVRDIVLN
jgi:single-stranded-DNA-specific exonuclease